MLKLIYLFAIVFLTTVHGNSSTISSNIDDIWVENEKDSAATAWLENSNKIAFGYNPIYGSPVCYRTPCQTDGFTTHPIFKLSYQSPAHGSCTPKLVPDNVYLNCVSEGTIVAHTDIITSLQTLQESIINRLESSSSLSFLGSYFAYKKSKETTYMIDTMGQQNMTIMYTVTQVSQFKLSMDELNMELSDSFRRVIEDMPCCQLDPAARTHILELFQNYGLMYMPTIVLGGIAQQSILMEWTKYKKLVSQGIDINKESNVNFFVTMNDQTQHSHNVVTQSQFSSQITSKQSSFVGGMYMNTINEWAQTVSSNPNIVKFSIKNITNLLTMTRFPNDTNLVKKKELIEKVLVEYIGNPLQCINSCTSALHGTCKPSGYFQISLCQCRNGWYGEDCSKQDPLPPIPSNIVPKGTICGYQDGKITVHCFGQKPAISCPPGYTKYSFGTPVLNVCYKSVTTRQNSTIGTICGLINVGSNVDGTVACNHTFNQYQHDCPSGYTRSDYRDSALFTVCWSASTDTDLPGTLCGMQRLHQTVGPDCNGSHPGLQQCPAGYQYGTWRHFSSNQFSVCYKIS